MDLELEGFPAWTDTMDDIPDAPVADNPAELRLHLFRYAAQNLIKHILHVPYEDNLWLSFMHLAGQRSQWLQTTPLRLAILEDLRFLAKKFLDHGHDIDESLAGETTLAYCIRSRLAKDYWPGFLLDHGSSPNLGDPAGNTPLHLTMREGKLDTTRRLLSIDIIDLNRRDAEGKTPLHLAVTLFPETLLIGLLKRVNVGIIDNSFRTALAYAAFCGERAIVRRILENSNSLHIHQEQNMSPIVCAAQ